MSAGGEKSGMWTFHNGNTKGTQGKTNKNIDEIQMGYNNK